MFFFLRVGKYVSYFYFYFTSNFCYAIFHVKRYVPATNAPAMILQQHYNLRHVLVVKHRYSMQQYVVVCSSTQQCVSSMQQYVVVGTCSSMQQYVVIRSTSCRKQYVVLFNTGSMQYHYLLVLRTVDTKSMIRTYVVQYVHSQQREKNEFNAGRRIQR